MAEPRTVEWRGRNIRTGIYKYPVDHPIKLDVENVENDTVIDRKHHGGEYKACYLFGAEHYNHFKEDYPHLPWSWGMFGENITLDTLDENKLAIGAIYKLGNATIQITEPRQPCHKLGIRFGDQNVIKKFIEHAHPGTYVRILDKGEVKVGDKLVLIKAPENTLTVHDYNLIVNRMTYDSSLVQLAIENTAIRAEKREKLKKWLQKNPG